MSLPETLRKHLFNHLDLEIQFISALSGGSVGQSYLVKDQHGKKYFLKWEQDGPADRFPTEARGLRELSLGQAIKVPEVFSVGEHYLLLEYLEPGMRGPDFFREFGRGLAQLHQYKGSGFGFFEDNYCGQSRQKNTPLIPVSSEQDFRLWAEFYYEKRLLFQYELMRDSGKECHELGRSLQKLENKMEKLLAGSFEPPALLHGDLWAGNFGVTKQGRPCLFDPAVYYGHREADLAMTTLFGGFPREFYDGYEEVWPLKKGYEARQGLYQLYHVFNHYNIFGGHYYEQALRILKHYL